MRTLRHTKIIATLGPATESREQLERLIRAGIDVIRLNMAHATTEWVRTIVRRIRDASASVARQVAVMMDVKGPEIRTGVVSEPIVLEPGQTFTLYTTPVPAGAAGVDVNYPGLPLDVQVGATVLLDNGLIRMQVVDRDQTSLVCRVTTPGRIGSRRHINLPGVDVNLPSLTEKDELDVRVGVEAGCDFFALSFVRRPDDILVLRALLDRLGSQARIVAKI
ncbi:MAG: pyruvate kinase, partial [Vicinamibacterales bacterium]